ncbi:hypothetical protein WJX84_005072 [Apatococcus fuscideae]|uniref:Calponin-homology (CH) domain-containing protein n=1 Tax=Apatococcus fuscideae TaxID=2026836 RepID=A0AAW1SMF8_9CHLO
MTTPILPRHVITWLQGLKLSQPLRNIRRDLADGCILAEILSKYLPKDVQLHAFERATSRQRKKANWKLLTKILKSYRFPIDSKLEDSIIDADEAAAFEILVVLHDFLIEQQDWQQEENRDEPSCSQSLHSEHEADKEKRLRKIHAKEFSEQIRQHNMYQMATESHKACPKHEFPRAQSKRDRALDFARQVSKPAVRQHPLELGLHDAAEREQQTPLQHLEQHYLANQQQVAAVFGS